MISKNFFYWLTMPPMLRKRHLQNSKDLNSDASLFRKCELNTFMRRRMKSIDRFPTQASRDRGLIAVLRARREGQVTEVTINSMKITRGKN